MSYSEKCLLANQSWLPGGVVSQGFCGFNKSPLSQEEPCLGEGEQPPIGLGDCRLVPDPVKDCQG